MRCILKILAAAGLALVIAGALLPWWLGGALRIAAPRVGVEFGEYERVSYGRWALTDVTWRGEPGELAIQRVELPHPLWLLLQGNDAGPLLVEAWHWRSAGKKEVAAVQEEESGGWNEAFDSVQQLMTRLPHRLPPTELKQGTLIVGKQEVTIRHLAWDPSKASLSFDDLVVLNTPWSGQARWDGEQSQLIGRLTSSEGSAQFTASSDGVQLEGSWWDQPMVATAKFGRTGWLPVHAELKASDWTLPGSRLGLAGQFEKVKGQARAVWQDEQFELSVTAAGEPVADHDIPPLRVSARAHGDLHGVVIEELAANAPGLQAHLSKPVALGRLNREMAWDVPAVFTVEADLAVLTNEQGSGTLKGEMEVNPTGNSWPKLKGRLEASAMRWQDWPSVSGEVVAGFDGEILNVASLEIRADDDSRLEASGDWAVEGQSVGNLEVNGVITRRWVARWLPEELAFSGVKVTGTANGTWPELQHEGTLIADDLVFGKLNSTNWKLAWEGTGREVTGTAEGTAGESRLMLEAMPQGDGLRINRLILKRADKAEMALVKPAVLNWESGLLLDELELQGPDDGLLVSLREQGHWHLQATRLEQAWLSDWVLLPGPTWFVENLLVDGKKIRGAWQGRVNTKAAVDMGEDRSAQITLEMRLDDEGLQIETGSVSEGELPILNISGSLPLTLNPDSPDEKWSFDSEEALSLQISSADNPAFWEQVHKAVGVEVKRPVINGTLSGTWNEAAGEITGGAELIRFDPERWGTHWPELKRIQAHLTGSNEGLVLDRLTARIFGQEVRASGLLPLDQAKLTLLRDDPWAYLRQAGNGKIEIPDADLSAWATLAPKVLAPSGRLRMSLRLTAGGEIDGSMHLEGAALRPIGPLGALQDITAEVRFEGRRVTIESVEAQTGGRPVELKGEANWLDSGQPRFDLSLRGKNLPFVRQTGLLLRGDVDLKLQTNDDGVTWVRGGVGLRDGLFLVDLESLRPSPGSGGGSAGRPPYFSVTDVPFADWRLDVAVKGTNFLRMETPVFSGRASADFQLTGTLRDPRAIGEAVVTEGVVKLPFATFDVTEGWVRLRQSDPHEFRISVIGSARRMDYDLRMELTGTGSAPTLQFFSNPPLSSEEVLLLVMAGESPQNGMNYTSSQRATKLGAYLGRNLINQFTGNRDRDERLAISFGDNISQNGRETYRIEYYLDGRWSLVGEYDEFDDYNAGVKWRVFSSRKEKKEGKDDE